jgi:tetratricopeptide (TPR) repeat protein
MKHNLTWIVIFINFWIWTPGVVFALDSNAEKTAATLFNNQQYKEALEIWREMVGPKSNAGLFFNIGLAESKLDQHALAIYSFEQALRISPLNSSYAKALETERKKMDNPVIPLRSFFLERWYLGWITLLRPGVWAMLGLVIIAIGLLCYLVAIKALPGKTKMTDTSIRSLGLVGLFFLATSLLSAQYLFKRDEGIIMKSCALKQASSVESPTLRQLSAGEKVKITDQIGDWYYVALLNLDYGWIQANDIRRITINMSYCKPTNESIND